MSSLKDDDLAGRIGLQAKELNKLMAVLTNDRLVQVSVVSNSYSIPFSDNPSATDKMN